MTHRGPFQPLPFCDSVILWSRGTGGHATVMCSGAGRLGTAGPGMGRGVLLGTTQTHHASTAHTSGWVCSRRKAV